MIELQIEFHRMIDDLVALNKKFRDVYAERYFNEGINDVSWVRNFCTIKCCISRGAGKTEYIVQNAVEGDLIVVAMDKDKERLKAYLGGKDIRVVALHELERGFMRRSRKYKTIYVDEPDRVFVVKGQLEKLYFDTATGDKDQTYIFLGN